MEEVVTSEGGTGQQQGEGNGKTRLQTGGDLSWTLTFVGKKFLGKMCSTSFLSIFSNIKEGVGGMEAKNGVWPSALGTL